MASERERFARLTARIYREVRAESYPGENGRTTERVEEALEVAERLAGEEPGTPRRSKRFGA